MVPPPMGTHEQPLPVGLRGDTMRLVIFLASTQGPLATNRLSSRVFCPVEL